MADKNIKICIIGGGPAGLSAAMHLEKKGYMNYTILEKDDHVGGKCHSPYYDGKRYEMGAIMGCPTYNAVHEVEEFCGFTHDGPAMDHIYKRSNGKQYFPFDPKKNFIHIFDLIKMKSQVKQLGNLLETKYKGYEYTGHKGIAEGKYDGFDSVTGEHVTGVNENLKDLCKPFKDFCEMNGVPLAQKAWIAPYTAFGYGYFDEIPAAYVLKYLDFATAMYFLNGNLWTWMGGTQSIWERLNDKITNHAMLNQNIEKVERKDGKVYVTVNGKVTEYDKVIITAPLQYMDKYFDATKEEKELFSKIDYERYEVQACVIKDGKYPGISSYMFDNMELSRIGHLMVYFVRWMNDPKQVVTTYVLRNHKGKELVKYEDAKKMAVDDLAICGADVEKVVNDIKWYYFPHVFEKDYADGWYEKVEAMQGNNNTYYAGEVMSFGDMEETAQYSKDLVARFF